MNCPECGSNEVWVMIAGMSRGDTNRARCDACGWQGEACDATKARRCEARRQKWEAEVLAALRAAPAPDATVCGFPISEEPLEVDVGDPPVRFGTYRG